MPGVQQDRTDTNNKPVIAGAICAPPPRQQDDANSNGEGLQPRQPASLQGLLRYAMEATKTEDAPYESHMAPLSEERKKFLEEALSAMTVDVIDLLQKQIQILRDVDKVDADTDTARHEEAFNIIVEYIDDIDTANDFHKIGGFTLFKPCLQCCHPKIKAEACNLLAELCQNNPYCQRVVLDNCFISPLLTLLKEDEDAQVCIKALYAISCIVRDNTEGFDQLIQYGGLDLLLKVLQRNEDKLRTKTAFLLSSLCGAHPDLKSRLVYLEYVPVLVNLISNERMPSHEHILSLLVLLVEDNQSAVNECRNGKYKLKEVLENYIETVKDKDECLEELSYCKRLLSIVFTSGSNGL